MFGVGMSLYGSADRPWDRVWAATDGFHVSATYYPDRDVPRADVDLDAARTRFAGLADAPDVAAVGGPWIHLYGLLDVDGGTEDLTAGSATRIVPPSTSPS